MSSTFKYEFAVDQLGNRDTLNPVEFKKLIDAIAVASVVIAWNYNPFSEYLLKRNLRFTGRIVLIQVSIYLFQHFIVNFGCPLASLWIRFVSRTSVLIDTACQRIEKSNCSQLTQY